MVSVNIPLAVDQRDFRWQLLREIPRAFDLRRVRKIIARYTLKSVPVLKIVTTSMFFSTRISHVINELRNKKDLREFIGYSRL